MESITIDLCERRVISDDRRQRVWWALLYGSFHPRRRVPPRRVLDSRLHLLDWHAAHLFAVALGILLLSLADAFMTVTLLANGAREANPVMATVVYNSVGLFAGLKMGLTGISVTLLVSLARYRLLRVLRVDVAMYVILVGYACLLAYEMGMLRGMENLPGL